jgi:octaprenyl-diphosphate synthase
MDEQYTRYLENIEAVIEEWLPDAPGADWGERVFPGMGALSGDGLFAPLTAPGRDLLSRGGKRWRPLLMSLVCESLGGGGAALPLAPLVEFCHTASLIHDDIEDNSDQRRGKAAVHLIYGQDTAINSGCFLYFLPLSCVEPWALGLAARAGLGAGAAVSFQARVFALWADHMKRLHLGQALDIYWHRDSLLVPALDAYYQMCALKTGCLARFAAALGVCAAEAASGAGAASSGAGEGLGAAAEKLGLGFQILDDVKNLTTGIPGKRRGDDVIEGKKSLPVLLFLHRYPERRDLVFRCFAAARAGGPGAPEVEELICALSAAGVLGEARERGAAFIAEGSAFFSAYPLLADFAGLVS